MARLRPVRPVGQTGKQRLFETHIRELLQPVGSKLVKLICKHLLIIRQHIAVGDPLSQLPDDPLHEPFWHRLFQIAARLRYGSQVRHLFGQRKLPDIGFQRMAYLHALYPDPAVPRKERPLLLRQEPEQELVDLWPSHIEKMPAADIKRAAVHHHRTAQAPRLGFLFQYQKRSLSQLFQSVRQCQPGWAGTEDQIVYSFHVLLLFPAALCCGGITRHSFFFS